MKKLFISLTLLSAIFVSIIAVCPDYPTIPTTTPLLITPSSPGVSHFPSSTTQLSITMVVTPTGCPSSGMVPLLSMSNLDSGSGDRQYFQIALFCDPWGLSYTFDSYDGGYLWGQEISSLSSPSSDRPLAFFLSFNLAGTLTIQIDSESDTDIDKLTLSSPGTDTVAPFDANSEFYLCADKNGASPWDCTVSHFIIEYQYYTDVDGKVPYGHLGGTPNPTIAGFYPFLDGSLAPSVGSASSAYFGDKASNPTTGTTPTWDSSNDLVAITAGQFLTFPLPSFASGNLAGSKAFGFAAWIKISSLSADQTTLFAMYSADGTTQVGYSLQASKSTGKVSLTFGSHDVSMSSNPTVVLNEWKLVGFTAYLSAGSKWTEGTVFFGTDTASFSTSKDGTDFPTVQMNDLSSVSMIRIGDAINSFSGQASFVNMLTPGGGFVKTTDLCSSTSRIELGADSFSVACSGTNSLYPVDSTCYATCPSGTHSFTPSFTGAPASLCVDCPKSHCKTCDDNNCLTCVASYLFHEGDCVNPCPDGTYSDGTTCQDCPSHCKTCDSTKCLSCDSGYTESGGSCSSSGGVSCSDGTYLDGSTCKNCPSNCKTCSSSGCSVCDSGFQLYKAGCVNPCPAKTYKSGSTCKDCASDCSTCDSKACLTCPSGFTLSGGSCISLCGDKMYYDGSTCQNCATDCKTCNADQCYTCDSGYLLYDGDCLGSCPAKTYQSGSTCKDCSLHCATCESSQCLACEANYLSYKGGCVGTCPAKSYADLTSCITCPNHCSECNSDGCKACENGYKLGTDNSCKATTTVISSGSGLSGGAIAGIVVGSLLVIGTASWIFYLFLKKSSLRLFKKNRKIRPFDVQTPSDFEAKTITSPTNAEAKALIP